MDLYSVLDYGLLGSSDQYPEEASSFLLKVRVCFAS
jgi:hypothetical protein